MKTQEPRAVIWDLDGVIADTASAHLESWQFAYHKQGIAFFEENFQKVFGQRNDIIIRQLMGNEFSQALVDSISTDKEVYFREHIVNNLKPFPGVIALLKLLKEQGIKSAVGSSGALESIQTILSGLKIEDYFQTVVYGLEVAKGKPFPDIFQKAAQKLGVDCSRCIVIEDAIVGVQAARRAAMHCIAVTNTHHAEALKEADLVVDSLEKIDLNVLNKLFDLPITPIEK
jgi:beta-phosphoglucomutase